MYLLHSLSSTSKSQSLTNLLTAFRFPINFLLLSISLQRSLRSSCAVSVWHSFVALFSLPSLERYFHPCTEYIGGTLDSALFKLTRLLYQTYHGWTRLWCPWSYLQGHTNASSHISPGLHWHGCQFHLRYGQSE